jgi:hypothetical protein
MSTIDEKPAEEINSLENILDEIMKNQEQLFKEIN